MILTKEEAEKTDAYTIINRIRPHLNGLAKKFDKDYICYILFSFTIWELKNSIGKDRVKNLFEELL